MIDDESKKFIKDTIEDAIDKKLDDRDKKSAAQKRIEDLKNEKKSLEDRKKLLAELQERDKKGENTIAQKFEMLKLSVDNAIPQDLKDAYSGASKTIGSGASQVGKGLGHLTQKAMLSNPLTAFLYQNRDVFGAVGDVGIGAAKMGWGAVKGIGHGALGLANTAMNMFKPKEEEQTEEEEYELPKTLFGGKEESLTDKLADEQQDWQKKINQMHKILTQDLSKEQKKSSDIMSKGLGGLNKTMEAIKGFTDVIASKQKLILGGVLLGAAAIVGLAAWFKSGGLQKLLQNYFQADENDPSNTQTQQANNQLNSLTASTDWATKDNSEIKQALTEYKDNKVDNIGKQTTINQADLQKSGRMDRAIGAGEIDHGKFNGSGYDVDITAVQNEKPVIFKLPFEVRLKKVIYSQDKGNEQYANVVIERRRKLGNKTVVITKVMQVLFPEGEMIPKNTPFLLVGENFDIIGDWKQFTNTEGGYVDYTKYWSYNDNAILNNFDKARTNDIKNKHTEQIKKDTKRQTYFKNLAKLNESNFSKGVAQGLDNVQNFITGNEVESTSNEQIDNNQQETPSISTNQVKADEQNKKLNESTKKTETEKTSNNDVQGQKLSSASTTMQLPGTGYRYADKGLTTTEYNNMRDTDIV